MSLNRRACSALVAGAAFSALLAGALLTGLAPTATSFHSTAASTPSCEANSERTTVSGTWSPVLTHLRSYRAAPGADRRTTHDAVVVRRLTAAVTGTGNDSLSARQILEKAEATYDTTLAAVGRRTSGSPQKVTLDAGSSSTAKSYALFHGRRYWKGTWKTSWCAADGRSATVLHQGTWRSFSADREGTGLCPVSRSEKRSLSYIACKATRR